LLIYRLGGAGDAEQIIFVRAGTHAEPHRLSRRPVGLSQTGVV
jgi:hypothetical protein